MNNLPSTIIGPDLHHINNNDIDPNALKVIHELKLAGFEAFIVGGGIRDLLLDMKPKDFDVATSATPEEAAQAIKRSRVIGRRFKLVHALFGRDLIEVATYRASHQGTDGAYSKDGMIINDNVYGSREEDAQRRDFTINALYYDPESKTIYDYVGGLEDLKRKRLAIIGDPEQRFTEDPARMLRLARLKAKLDLDVAPATLSALHKLSSQLTQVSSARMFEEINKVFMGGHAESSLHTLQELNLFSVLFPVSSRPFDQFEWALPMLEAACRNTDERIRLGKPITPAFLYAVILWPAVSLEFKKNLQQDTPPVNALIKASSHVLRKQQPICSIPKRHSTMIREIWDLQLRLPKRAGKRAERTIAHPRFRAAYDFLLLREESGELPVSKGSTSLGEWWTQYQEENPSQRKQRVQKLAKTPGRRKKK